MNSIASTNGHPPTNDLLSDRLRIKLDGLRAEFQRGETELVAVERRRLQITESLLQLRGAIQALSELESEAVLSTNIQSADALEPGSPRRAIA